MHRGEIIGRDAELAELTAFVTGPGGGALVVRGDAGVGKSALLDAAAARAEGHRVLRAVGVEAESAIAYAGLHQLLHPLLAHAGDVDPAFDTIFGRGDAEPPSVLALGIAVLDLLALAAGSEPLLLVVDDAHWFDPQSTEVCTFLARRLAVHAVRLLAGVRSEIESGWDGAALPELHVSPLAAEAAAELLDRAAPGLPAAARERVLRVAEGNPLALLELPRAAGDGDDLPLSRRLERLYGSRVAALAPASRAALLRAALDGRTRHQLSGVDDAIAAGLVIPAGADLVFRHPLVRSAVLHSATPNERRAAHAWLAARYEADAERYATHLAAATVDPSEEVAAALEEAAHSASARGGAAAAVAMLTRAAELSPSARSRSSRLEEAAFVAAQAALFDRAELARLGGAYTAFYRDGDLYAAHRLVAAALSGDADAETRGRLLPVLLALSMYAQDPALWAVVPPVRDPLTALYRDAWGDVARTGGGVAARVREAFGRVGDGQPWDVMRLGVAAFYVDALAEHRALVRRVAAREEDGGAVSNAMTLLQLVMLDQIGAGEWDAATATGQRGLELTIEHGYALFEHQFYGFLGLLSAWRGDLEAAWRAADRLDRWARPRRVGYLTDLAEAIGAAAGLTSGDYESAYAYASGITAPGSFTPYSKQAVRTFFDLVEAAVHTGRASAARRHAVAARDLGLPAVSGRLAFLVEAALAMVEEPGASFEAAVAHPAAALFPFDRARVRLAQGMWLRRQRERSAARAVLAEAAGEFERLGAAPWAARARAELKAGGAAPSGGASALTAQEREIAELAASGLSNKEIGAKLFLSPRTVGAHLYRLFPKLGVSSRASLRDALSG
ncbi:helix-turn-helix transcriptional regulator [Paractinoplanes globisporus]|uniref:AAA family ATPase n=1 Tax=Paractinoplanes globisporus TaxID=113565 RepID=A0ABW6WUG5_9ACTN|nr:LuxR family transcriptional regulator [Actinoplanes globisporus]